MTKSGSEAIEMNYCILIHDTYNRRKVKMRIMNKLKTRNFGTLIREAKQHTKKSMARRVKEF